MRLVTTPELPREDEGEVLLLGRWCLSADVADAWKGRRYHLLPYHWAEPKEMRKAYSELDAFGEVLLRALAGRLNAIHGRDHSLRFWRILAGRWITYFVPVLFDRYRSLETAAKDGRATVVETDPAPIDSRIASTEGEFLLWAIDDNYNRWLFGRMAQIMGTLPWRPGRIGDPPRAPAAVARSSLARDMARIAAHAIPPVLQRVAFWAAPLDRMDRWTLAAALGQIGFVAMPPRPAKSAKIDWTTRKRLASLELPATAFGRVVAQMLPETIPQDLIEGFALGLRAAERGRPRRPKAILTGAVVDDSVGRMWTALNVERGARLIVCQHGGNYGSGAFTAAEDHEVRCADAYFSWGWNRPGANVVPLPGSRLIRPAAKLRPTPEGPAALVLAGISRYAYWLFAAPQAQQFEKYLNDQCAFIESLPDRVRSHLLVRLYPQDYGWGVAKRLSHLPVRFSAPNRKTSFHEELSRCRLMVGTYNATTFLETLAANYPTLLFWDFESWPIRDSAKAEFDALVEAGILHATPSSAAAKLAEIFDCVPGWWQSGEVQRARELFVGAQARTSPHWARQWRDAIRSLQIDRRSR